MTKSMTGYGKAERLIGDEKIVLELRSLNSKQIDMNLKMPSQVRELEMDLRNIISEKLMRGKVELSLNLEGAMDKKATINQALAEDYLKQLHALSSKLELAEGKSDLLALVLRMPDVMQTERSNLDEKKAAVILELMHGACDKLNDFRDKEGEVLHADLKSHLLTIQELQEELKPYVDVRIDRIRERIQRNVTQQMEGKDIDKSRFEQELLFYLEKYDVNEEMSRLEAHCEYFLEILETQDQKGKKLGFITQELGREINTLGAKSYDAEMQKIVVKMKDVLEKIKEQTFNVL